MFGAYDQYNIHVTSLSANGCVDPTLWFYIVLDLLHAVGSLLVNSGYIESSRVGSMIVERYRHAHKHPKYSEELSKPELNFQFTFSKLQHGPPETHRRKPRRHMALP